MNLFRTTLLLTGLTLLFLMVGAALGGRSGMIFAFLLAVITNLGAYWFADTLVLKLYRAREITEQDPTNLFSCVRDLVEIAQLPMPKVFLIEQAAPNAFATGRNPANASVAATTGLVAMLNKAELTAVMAHELSHVKHRDTLISVIAATFAGAISMLANMAMWSSLAGRRDEDNGSAATSLLMILLAPLAAGLIQMAVSRSREYAADANGAKLTGNPLALASALRKIEASHTQYSSPKTERHPETAHLFIINPLKGKQLTHLFSTHPPTAERIRRLERMEKTGEYDFSD